jgi:hypothetical protein
MLPKYWAVQTWFNWDNKEGGFWDIVIGPTANHIICYTREDARRELKKCKEWEPEDKFRIVCLLVCSGR